MGRKHMVCALLAAALLFYGAPCAYAQEVVENMTPAAVTAQGVTLAKTAETIGPGAWRVTLSVAGGAVQNITEPVDIVLLLDCSKSMAAQSGAADGSAPLRTTRIAAAKRGAEAFLKALQEGGIPARIGVVAYAGTAETLLPLTNLCTADGIPDAAGCAAVENAVSNLWQVAYDATDLCGSSAGTNMERAFAAGNTLLRQSGAAAKYMILLGNADATVYGAGQYSCLVPETDATFQPQSTVYAETKATAQKAKENAARLFTVGVDTASLSVYASAGAAYTAEDADALSATLCEIAALLPQAVQGPLVTDVLADGFVLDTASVTAAPQKLGAGAQPYAKLSADGHTLLWSLGTWLPQGRTASLSYTVRLSDYGYTNEGKAAWLGNATLLWNAPRTDGSLQGMSAAFPSPAVCYRTGTLRVFSTGLPDGVQGTAHTTGKTLVTNTALYAVPQPAACDGCRLTAVVVNGEQVYEPAAFAAETGYRLRVAAGETTVEYRYTAAPAQTATWAYTVCYYCDGQPLPQYTYTAEVSAAAPVVTSVRNRLSALTGCYENPVRRFPLTLSANGETVRIDYLTLPRAEAQVQVKHIYTDADGVQVGVCVTTPVEGEETCAVLDLLAPSYGGTVYMPVKASVTAMPQTQGSGVLTAAPQALPLGGTFPCEQNCAYAVEIRYVPAVITQSAPS